jgi:serine/threonine protein phosphatase PrpC
MPLGLSSAARTHVGLVRSNNEDAFLAGGRLLAVADGVGGAAAGEIASATIIAALTPLDDHPPGYDLIGRLHDAIASGNAAIAEKVAADAALTGMGTTLTAVLFAGPRYGLVNVGDSRTYLMRGGSVSQLTRDDSYVQLLIDEGRITQEEADRHPQRSVVLQALTGQELLEPAISVHEARADDRFLLCSDGLSDLVAPEPLAAAMRLRDRDVCADRLVDLALEAGGRDNITVIVADVVEVSTDAALPAAKAVAVPA